MKYFDSSKNPAELEEKAKQAVRLGMKSMDDMIVEKANYISGMIKTAEQCMECGNEKKMMHSLRNIAMAENDVKRYMERRAVYDNEGHRLGIPGCKPLPHRHRVSPQEDFITVGEYFDREERGNEIRYAQRAEILLNELKKKRGILPATAKEASS